MAHPYILDLALEVALKLGSNDVFLFSKVSKHCFKLIVPEFWMTKVIRNFGSKLGNRVDYEIEYVVMENLNKEKFNEYIISKGYIKLISYLYSKLLLPDQSIIWAAESGNLEILRFLVDNAFGIHNKKVIIALGLAANMGFVDIVAFLLSKGYINNFSELMLRSAVYRNNVYILELFLANGVDIHAKDDYLLRYAVTLRYKDIVKLLIANGANIHARNDEVIRLATLNNDKEMINLLYTKN